MCARQLGGVIGVFFSVFLLAQVVAKDGGGRLPLPDAAVQEQAQQLVRQLYGEEYDKAKTAAEKTAMARKMLSQLDQVKGDPAGQFVLLKVARDVAVQAGDAELAMAVVDQIARTYDVDAPAMQEAALQEVATAARASSQLKVLAQRAAALAEAAAASEDFARAVRLAELGIASARKAYDYTLAKQIADQRDQFQQQSAAYAEVQQAQAVLQREPTNPEANLTIGRHLCLVKGDWDRGVARLALGSDPALKSLAVEELKGAESPDQQVALADGWWDLAQTREGAERVALVLHAGSWYEKACANASGLVRMKADKRLAEIAEVVKRSPGRAIPDAPAQELLTNSIGMQFVLIPAGEFVMGATEDDKDASDDEKPRHRVRISRPFYLGVYEVTQGEYEQVMGSNPSNFSAKGKNSAKVAGKETSRHPVETVSWEDAVQFCQKLSALPKERAARRMYRLPTEAEWEYGCRAGSATKWSFGNDPAALGDYAWFGDNSSGMTHPVGQKKPNAWGLYDMHGNVWEWCMDWYAKDFYGQSPSVNPVGPIGGSPRVFHGGGWTHDPAGCRSAFRADRSPGSRNGHLGLRVCRVPAE